MILIYVAHVCSLPLRLYKLIMYQILTSAFKYTLKYSILISYFKSPL